MSYGIENIKISVIIPVYNVRDYIEECMNSLIGQVFKDFEIICVDDCSSDSSYEKLVDYRNKYDFIKIYRNSTNIGAAECRNKGLSYANGKYVIFIDSDDICHEHMLEELFIECEEKNADAAFCNYNVYMNKSRPLKWGRNRSEKMERRDLIRNPIYSPWNKLVSKGFLISNHILFQNIPNANDVYYSLMVIALADKVSVVDSELYTYRTYRVGSLSLEHKKKSYLLFAYELFIQEMKKRNLWNKEIKESTLYMILRHSYNLVMNSAQREIIRRDFREKISLLLSNGDIEYINQSECLKYQYEYLIGETNIIKNKYQLCRTEIVDFLDQYDDQKVVLWGAGKLGILFIDALGKDSEKIECIIDNDKDKQGRKLENISIYAYDEKKNEMDVVLVLNPLYLEEIRQQVGTSVRIVDMEAVLDLV